MSYFKVEKKENLAKIVFERPPINMMSFEAAGELEQILRELARDENLSVVVLSSGVKGYFIAHADTDDIMRMENQEPPVGDPESWDRVNQLLSDMPQLTIAAVDGQAWGGGMETALACNLIVASDIASFRLFEVSKGTVPGAGGTQRLARKAGVSTALQVILSGKVMDAAEAFERGIVDEYLSGDDFAEQFCEWVQPFLQQPVHSFRGAKDAIVRGAQMCLADGLRLEKEWSAKLISSPQTKALGDKSLD